MNALFDQATRTAELLQKRTPNGRLEMLGNAILEGHATMTLNGNLRFIEWHGVTASGWCNSDVISNWLTAVAARTGEAA